ncbi:energy-coupling factor ABC transporter ATP-binding protein [Streptococcus loxodontisalivarius]|uniref:Energy-coupling factor transport system ATP-binding protein n=1 Tax=Streptococcus loxodontisalivarius TaxID=1349415 RepID=A0ABS2PQX5_9STRE|nr:energy-coupling factor ABC transporter ATP-binding protein [Streptococcus loxodontisalivarius]MBM7641899.1 energy-coupling factor transport system ATP-binding protein [Streptococcus loxodontisalivarius]
MIEVSDLTFRYQEEQEKPTLDKLSFHVKQGQWLSIVGHNGSGKSTTARLIDGLLVAESGSISIDGQILTEDNVWELRHKIGMVFQNPDNQFVGATVEDDIAFGLENQGISHAEMTERVQEALDLVGMSDFKTREPARLSGGQKQRVAIAGAIAMRPKLLIFDEATSMLDPEGRRDLLETIQMVRDKYEMTIISITHDLDEIALSDSVLVLKEGQVAMEASPNQLFALGEELTNLGLDRPFTSKLQLALQDAGWDLPAAYYTEKELEDYLWESLSQM